MPRRRTLLLALVLLLLSGVGAYFLMLYPGELQTYSESPLNYVRRSRSSCAALASSNYPAIQERLAAMRSAGGSWRKLALAAERAPPPQVEAILDAGYDLRCASLAGGPLLDLGERLTPWAAFLAAILAGVAALVSFKNYQFTRKSQRFANAVGLYRRYLELCIEYPDFAEPEPQDNIVPSDNDKYRRYQWFVGVLFRACEEVLEHGDDQVKWETTVREQLNYHRIFIRDSAWLNQEGLNIYSPQLQRMIKEIKLEQDALLEGMTPDRHPPSEGEANAAS